MSVVALVGALVLGPALLRRDQEAYLWDGAIGDGVLAEPIGVAYADGRLFVSDAAAQRVVVFDTAGRVLAVWGGDTAGGLQRPMHVSVGPDGLLYVAEYAADRITVLDAGGAVLRRIGGTTGSAPGQMDAPGGVAVRGDTIFVADFYNHRVQGLAAGGGWVIGRPGRVLGGRLHYPTDVATDDTLIFVADAYNHRVQLFRSDGTLARRWGGPLGLGVPGRFKGWFRVATGIAVAGGRVYVADFYNHRVQVFTDRGRYLAVVDDSLELPTDVAVGPAGEVYVADVGRRDVARLTRVRR